ncbi:13749_t:CDS:2 [Funneliformis mosseae]|uniref:13749_t:CDS:1 n=1 Tax=Funneliformis mosseae TaxID=27381 RepID=A0A9N8ZFM8_FUNMO|nr:13749_t:CDS:2 [Funneliformis mosseae]
MTETYPNIIAINKAKKLLESNLDSMDDDSENTNWKIDSTLTIVSEGIEVEDTIEIPQISKCAKVIVTIKVTDLKSKVPKNTYLLNKTHIGNSSTFPPIPL